MAFEGNIEESVLECLTASPRAVHVKELAVDLHLSVRQVRDAIGRLGRQGHDIRNEPRHSGYFKLYRYTGGAAPVPTEEDRHGGEELPILRHRTSRG